MQDRQEVLFAPHHIKPDPSEQYECLPIVVFSHRIDKARYTGRPEESLSKYVSVFGIWFRPRTYGFALCLN